jgi:Aerotolerance regulator N-terminal
VFWLNPSVLFALAAAAVPILIHLLIQRRAERVPFPTLRFLQPTRLASIRRHLLEDLPLLAVRVALLAAAVAAIAGPLMVTTARRQAWDRRVVRATVADAVGADLTPPANTMPSRADQARLPPAPYREKTFGGDSLGDGIRRAVLWLATAPPGRREIVIASSFPIGSLSEADIALIPLEIGVRFERNLTLPSRRTAPAGAVLTPAGLRARDVIFTAGDTSVREASAGDPRAFPIDVVAPAAERPAVDAAIAAVLAQRVWAGPADRRADVVLFRPASGSDVNDPTTLEVVQAFRPAVIQQPWMADAVVRIASDVDLRAAAARIGVGLSDARFSAAPWQPLVAAADGRPLVAAAGSVKGLVVVAAAPAADVATPVLLRSIANALAPALDLQRAEVVSIADPVLRRWSRSPMPVTSPRIESVDEDDRRWLWLAALCLMAIETWIRRARPAEVVPDRHEERERVA